MNDYMCEINQINPDWNAYHLFQSLKNYMLLYGGNEKGEEVTAS